MSKYNHMEFLKKDPVGEVNFIIGNIRRKAYECCSTAIGKLMLKTGRVKFGKHVRFRGLALVERFQCSAIEIGELHVQLFQPFQFSRN